MILCKASKHAGSDKDQMAQGSNDVDPYGGRINTDQYQESKSTPKGGVQVLILAPPQGLRGHYRIR